MISFIYKPIDVAVEAAKNLYPDLEADIQFNPSIESNSVIRYSENGWPFRIDINSGLPLGLIVTTLIDDLAHIATNVTDKQDQRWIDASMNILKEYSRLVDQYIDEYRSKVSSHPQQ